MPNLEHDPQDFGFMAQPQKRGAVHTLGTSASNVMVTKKARKNTAESDKQGGSWQILYFLRALLVLEITFFKNF